MVRWGESGYRQIMLPCLQRPMFTSSCKEGIVDHMLGETQVPRHSSRTTNHEGFPSCLETETTAREWLACMIGPSVEAT